MFSFHLLTQVFVASNFRFIIHSQLNRNSLVASSASINSHQDYNGMPLPPYQKCPDYNMALRARRRQSTNFEHHSGGSSHSGQINSNLVRNGNLPSSNSLANHKIVCELRMC